MASITIRNLDEALKRRLRLYAARHGQSMEAAARDILRCGLAGDDAGGGNLYDAIRRRFDKLGGVDIEPYPDEPPRAPPRFDA